jgi:TetR/AcrR family transcriptional regulator, regulator of cefoperazone and chloramphenicol sensitivity
MRAIAAAAGVTLGLLVHHYGTKDNIRDAVEELIVDHFRQAIAQAPADGAPGALPQPGMPR